jgi:hypothetical protein
LQAPPAPVFDRPGHGAAHCMGLGQGPARHPLGPRRRRPASAADHSVDSQATSGCICPRVCAARALPGHDRLRVLERLGCRRAKAFGFQVAWVNRQGALLEELGRPRISRGSTTRSSRRRSAGKDVRSVASGAASHASPGRNGWAVVGAIGRSRDLGRCAADPRAVTKIASLPAASGSKNRTTSSS